MKLVMADRIRSHLVLESNSDTTKWFPENLLAVNINETKTKINKQVYLGLSNLHISKAATTMQDCAAQISTASHCKSNLRMFMLAFQKILRKNFDTSTITSIDF